MLLIMTSRGGGNRARPTALQPDMDLTTPFRGSTAVRAGATTWRRLTGPAFDQLGPDLYIAAGTRLDLRGRATATALGVPGAVIGGYAAADALGADCAPRDAVVDLVVGRRRVRPREGVRVHQDLLRDEEVWCHEGLLVTSPLRTAFDLARSLAHDDAVVAVDALAQAHDLEVDELLTYPARRENPRGTLQLPAVVADADARAESPPETRARLLMHRAGLTPVPQLEVYDDLGVFVGRLDFAWEELRLGAEYQGDHHRTDREQWLRDARRLAEFAACGWAVLPITARDVYRFPRQFVRRMHAAVDARRRGLAGRAA